MPAYKYSVKNGKYKWYVNLYYTDITGKKVHKCKRGFDTRKEAIEWEHHFLDSEKENPQILFSCLVDNYLQHMSNRLKPTTLETKKYVITKKLLPFFKDMPIGEITPLRIQAWQNQLIQKSKKNGDEFSQTYLRMIHSQLSAILNYAEKFYGLKTNPCKAAGLIGESSADEKPFWTVEQFQEFIKHEQKTGYRLAFSLLFWSGMRLGELLALTVADLAVPNTVKIDKSLGHANGQDLILTPKTKKSVRQVSIPNTLYDSIMEYTDALCLEKTDFIFYFKKDAFRKEFYRATERAGLPRIRVHDLRHSHASMLSTYRIASDREIANRLGHESVKTTWETYSHVYPEKDKEIASELNTFISSENEEN